MKWKISPHMLVESAVLLAVGFVLSLVRVPIPLPGAGSITLVSMLPLVVLGHKYGPTWGMLCGAVHGLLQILRDGGIYPPPVPSFVNFLLTALLDYALAWAVIGLIAGLAGKAIRSTQISIGTGALVGLAGRYLCSFLSGVIIWSAYAPHGQTAVYYSLVTNGLYMVPEMITTTAAGLILFSIPVLRERARRGRQS